MPIYVHIIAEGRRKAEREVAGKEYVALMNKTSSGKSTPFAFLMASALEKRKSYRRLPGNHFVNEYIYNTQKKKAKKLQL